MLRGAVQLLFVLSVSTLWSSDAAIFKRPSRRESVFERNGADRSMSDIRRELAGRLKRAAGDPQFQETLLNDTNPRGIVQYSGKVVFVLTYDRQNPNTNVYRSSDYGYHFTKINSLIGGGTTLTANIYVSPEDPKIVYFASSSQSIIYISTDEGVTFTTRQLTPNTIDSSSLVPHPMLENWVLAHDDLNNVLYVSRDLGKTAFTKIADNVYSSRDYNWGEYPYDLDLTIVYYNTDDPTNTDDEVALYTQSYPYTEMTRNVFDPSLGSHEGYLVVDRYIFVQKPGNNTRTLWVSVDRQPFQQAHIPSTYNHVNYFVDSIKSLQALVIVQHDNNQFNLYMSEEMGVNYYLALSDLSVAVTGIDLEPIESVNYTTYIANQFVRDSPDDTNPVARTLISFDAGANWGLLTPPNSDCIQPLCSLHLHMSTSEYWRTGVYSQASAPGIIIAHGITGQALNNIDDTNLFISRDGGSTWSQTLEGTWGVSLLDLGGMIIAAKDFHNDDLDESKILKYSCDEGLNWLDLQFTDTDMGIFAVLTQPGEATTIASLFGVTVSGWAVVTIDFANAFPRDCTDNDYYQWIPSDRNIGSACLLGATLIIERHRPNVCCRNGQNYNRLVSHTPCACTSEDFECDYGYKHANGYSGECIRDNSVSLQDKCANGELTYIQSQGYHRIGGDVCSGGDESKYVAMEMSCCYGNTGGSNTTSIVLGCFVLVAVVIIVVFGIVLTVCFCKNRSGSSGSRGYRVVPPTYEPSPPPTEGVQNINSGDNDDRPLTP